MLEELIPSNIDLSSKTPKDLYNDLVTYFTLKNEKCSDESLKCKFQYFATSMIHLFKDSAVCYISPNVKIPYVCINVSAEGNVIIFRHSENLPGADKFRIILQIFKNVKDIQMVKTCTNLYTLEQMSFNVGNALHLCLRCDLNCVTFIQPNAAADFLTILYFKNEFSGVYHKTPIKLICARH